MLFDNEDSATCLATYRLLRNDKIYFSRAKSKDSATFEPRPADQVGAARPRHRTNTKRRTRC
jgi:hypothetical protein